MRHAWVRRIGIVTLVLAMGLAASLGQADAWTITARGTIVSSSTGDSDHAGLFGAFGAPLIGLPYSATITTDPSLNSNIVSDTSTSHSTSGGSAEPTGPGARYYLTITVNGMFYALTESNPLQNQSYLQSVRVPNFQDQVVQNTRSLGCRSALGACTDWYINAYSLSVPFLPSLDFNQSLTVSEGLDPGSQVYFSFRDAEGQYTSFYGSISTFSINLASIATTVDIDILPADSQNIINLGSKGLVRVAVLGSASFNVHDVDVSTVRFAGASPEKVVYDDVNSDGVVDLVFSFRIQDLQLTPTSTQATLTGNLREGSSIVGTDSVKIVPSK